MSSAIVHQQEVHALSAAEQIRDSELSKDSTKSLAKVALARGRGDPMPEVSSNLNVSNYQRIAILKGKIRTYPRNAINYLDLALAYSAIGQNSQARKAVYISVVLAKNNRYVLRSASRF